MHLAVTTQRTHIPTIRKRADIVVVKRRKRLQLVRFQAKTGVTIKIAMTTSCPPIAESALRFELNISKLKRFPEVKFTFKVRPMIFKLFLFVLKSPSTHSITNYLLPNTCLQLFLSIY